MLELHVAVEGNDRWSGQLASPTQDQKDGPLATLAGARNKIRELRKAKAIHWPITVFVHGGRYAINDSIEFTPEDSGPITFCPYKKEIPVLDGSVPITHWQQEKLPNGKMAWVSELPDVKAGTWYFRTLFVDGQRRPRPTLPRQGEYKILGAPGISEKPALFDGSFSFFTDPAEAKEYRNQTDIDVLIGHFWVEERMQISSWNQLTGLLISPRRSIFNLKAAFGPEWAGYRLENVFEALEVPGEWYLDRSAGKLYYLPLPGQKPENTTVTAPRVNELIVLRGSPDGEKRVEYLSFKGLSLIHTDYRQPEGDVPESSAPQIKSGTQFGSDAQAAVSLSGAIQMESASNITIEDCTISNVGGYAINMTSACCGNRVVGNHLFKLGGGGVKIVGVNAQTSRQQRSDNCSITDNHIHDIGEIFKPAIGVITCHSAGNHIAHNHIHHTHYSGISVGWVWGYAENVSRDNIIEKNHIHHIGKGVLSDMGGIYTLGVQPGTVIRGNLIHDIVTAHYGGWAIYPDEGSSHLIIENNICYDTDSSSFHCHYGRELIIRNNIFAFSRKNGLMALTRHESHNTMTITGNIMITNGTPLYQQSHIGSMNAPAFKSDHNIIFDVKTRRPSGTRVQNKKGDFIEASLKQLQNWGLEKNSVVSDPHCRNIAKRDFTTKRHSTTEKIGFKPIDLSNIGPRESAHRL